MCSLKRLLLVGDVKLVIGSKFVLLSSMSPLYVRNGAPSPGEVPHLLCFDEMLIRFLSCFSFFYCIEAELLFVVPHKCTFYLPSLHTDFPLPPVLCLPILNRVTRLNIVVVRLSFSRVCV